MEPREFICNIYRGDWTIGVPGGPSSGGFPAEAQVDNWIAALTACRFTAVAFNEYIRPASETNWDLWGSRVFNSTPGDTILRRLKDAGFKILLRFWAGIHNHPDSINVIKEKYGGEVIGPLRPIMGNVHSLNVYSPKSIDLISDFATAMKDQGIYDMANWVSIGWDDSGEVDDIRDFAEMPTLTRPVRPAHTLISRTETAPPRGVAPVRTVRIHDAHEAIGIMFKAVLDVFGNSKPIGCMRGSCWHDQPKRRNLPFFPGETLVQTNDVNQLTDTDCTGTALAPGPFWQSTADYVQQEALAFSCDILRGSGIATIIAEADHQALQAGTMNPGGGNLPLQQAEIQERACIGFSRGVSSMVTHWGYARITDPIAQWTAAFAAIRGSDDPETPNPRRDPPLPPEGELAFAVTGSNYGSYIPDTVSAWRSAGGTPSASVPVGFQYSLP